MHCLLRVSWSSVGHFAHVYSKPALSVSGTESSIEVSTMLDSVPKPHQATYQNRVLVHAVYLIGSVTVEHPDQILP
jgi:hypothetical protein